MDIEQINKLRKSLGQPLIPVPSGDRKAPAPASDDGDEQDRLDEANTAERNWNRYQEDQAAARAKLQRKENLAKLRKRQAKNLVMDGPTLAETGGKLDTKAWLKGQKGRIQQIQLSWQTAEDEEEERERTKAAKYTSQDLAGAKIGHDIDDFAAGTDQVLTLQDREIGADDDDDDEDILENSDVRASERVREKSKKKETKSAYNPLDDEKKSLLFQYDEEIDGKKKNRPHFVLDSKGRAKDTAKKVERAPEQSTFQLFSDIFAPSQQPESDFKEAKVKKKKTKESKMDVDGQPMFKKRDKKQDKRQKAHVADGTESEVTKPDQSAQEAMDIDDKHASAAKNASAVPQSRKRRREGEDQALLQPRREGESRGMTSRDSAVNVAEKILKRVKEAATVEQEEEEEAEDIKSMSMANFLEKKLNPAEYLRKYQEDEENELMAQKAASAAAAEEVEAIKAKFVADADGDVQMDVEGEGLEILEEQTSSKDASASAKNDMSFGTIGETLSLLRKRGDIKVPDQNVGEKAAKQQQFLQKRRMIASNMEGEAQAKKFKDRASGKYAGMSNAQKNEAERHENERREQQEAFALAEGFDEHYQPTFNLEYADENGRLMDRHEAFRVQSHMFHGKMPGNTKQAKYAKKLEKDRETAAHQIFDIGRQAKTEQHREEKKQAGYRLG